MRRLLAIMLAGIVIAGCGSATRKTPATPSPNPLGQATGQAFVRAYDPTRDKAPAIMADDFVLWVSGKATNAPGNPPAAPLTRPERSAAAGVVLAYAQRLVAKGEISPNVPGGQSVLDFLRTHGVD